MTTAPISASFRTRPTPSLQTSPLTVILVIPVTDYVADPDVTLPANVFPPNALTEIHGGATGNYTSLGDVPSVDANTKTAIARAAYDFIESGSLVHLFALPFPVAQSDDAPTRAGKVVTAINTALNSAVERAKMPNSTADIIIVPRETVAGTAANPIYSALEVQCAPNKIGAVGLVDAGGGAALSNTARPLDTEPTDANVALWGANNRNLHIYAVSNRADISHYDRMWGSVIAGAHHARYTSREGIGAHPWNLRDPVLGIGQTYPQRVFDESDGSSAAVKLDRDDKIASLINFQGIQYLWGGESYATEEDPRQIIGNQIVANRMIKRAKRVMAPFLKARRRGTTLDTLRLSIEQPLQRLYVPDFVTSVEVREPVIAQGHISAILDVGFYEFVDSVALVAELYYDEPA